MNLLRTQRDIRHVLLEDQTTFPPAGLAVRGLSLLASYLLCRSPSTSGRLSRRAIALLVGVFWTLPMLVALPRRVGEPLGADRISPALPPRLPNGRLRRH